jgi:hypothetical protein
VSRRVIRANGLVEPLAGPVTLLRARELINAETLDTVKLHGGLVMLVDDTGHERRLPLNREATGLYWATCKPGTTHFIVGDIVIVPDADFA